MQRVRFTFLDRLIKEPVVYQLGRDFDVVTNIRRADIQENVGWVILELEGEDEAIDRGARLGPLAGRSGRPRGRRRR